MEESICHYKGSMRELLEAINHQPAGTAFIVNDDKKLCGIITDGDFRRLLLKGKAMDEHLTDEDYGDYIFAKKGEKLDDLLQKTNRKINIIPIVDEEHHLVDYFLNAHKTKFIPIAEPSLSNTEFRYLMDAFTSTWISSKGKYIEQFESGFAAYSEAKHGVATSNGTVSIHLALKALGIDEGDEVIVPDLTFAATINAVILAKATPVIVDINEDDWTISVEAIKSAITSKTKAIIPVHVYGQPCDMESIMEVARKNDIYVIEDCAEAHGAKFKGKTVGSFGDIATYSFFANKIITTGEGGMCLTQSDELNTTMRILRDHGMNTSKRYWHDHVGYNYRMTNLQAAIGCAQLENIEQVHERNNAIEAEYIKHLSPLGLFHWQKRIDNRDKVVWLMSCLSDRRDEIMEKLSENQIDVRPFFYCLSDMPVYKSYAIHPTPIAKKVSAKGMNLPTVEGVDYERFASLLSELV